ncbi:MAG: hypothetical protein MHM6MM_003295 [Cercozoa sp. M6MM]
MGRGGSESMLSDMALTQSASAMLSGMVDTSNPILAFMWNFVVITLIGAVAAAVRDGDLVQKIKRLFSSDDKMGFSLRFRAKDPMSVWSHRILSSNEFKAWLGMIREVVQNKSKDSTAGEGLKYLQEFLNAGSIYDDESSDTSESRFMPDQVESFRLDEHIWIKFEENRQTDNNKTTINYDLHVFVRDYNKKQYLLDKHIEVMEMYHEAARTRLKKPHIFVLGGADEDQDSITWKMYPFSSTRKMEHVWFKQRNEFLTAYNNFVNGREAYERRGDPWTFSALLFGHPGCGKTSLLKAIANEAKQTGNVRHMFVIPFQKIESADMLTRVIFDEQVNGYRIPLHQRMLVFEDFDANESAKVFKKRKNLGTSQSEKERDNEMLAQMVMAQQAMMLGASNNKSGKKSSDNSESDEKNEDADKPPSTKKKSSDSPDLLSGLSLGSFGSKKLKISLSEVLNALDGLNERTGSIALWTTNIMNPRAHFDPAFLRPGRMDLIIEFTPADAEGVAFLVRRFFGLGEEELTAEHVRKAGVDEDVFTPAQIKQVCKESTCADDALMTLQKQCVKVPPPVLTRMWSQGPIPLTEGVAKVEVDVSDDSAVVAAASTHTIKAVTSADLDTTAEVIEDDMPIDYDD